MQHLANFVRGIAVVGCLAALMVSCVALPIWFSMWVSGGAIWGLPICIVMMASLIGGAVFAFSEATK